MKVAQITPYYPPCKGGISRFVSGLVRSIKDSSDVYVISKEGEVSENVSIISSGKGRFILSAHSVLKKLRPDVVHCHSHWHMAVPAVVYKKFHPETKVIFTFHTEPPERKHGIKYDLLGRLLSRCDVVTYVSAALKESISSQVNITARHKVIFPGVTKERVRNEEIQKFAEDFGMEGKSPILVFIGLLEWEKKVQGLKVLLEAVKSLRKKYPSMALLIVGDGSKRGEVEDYVSDLDLKENVTITGLVENVYIPLSLCDIYAHISLQEGLPQSLIEAMSLGKPIVASNTGGIPEVIIDQKTGLLVETRVDDVASAISALSEDKERAGELGRTAMDFVKSNLSWKMIGEAFLKIYATG